MFIQSFFGVGQAFIEMEGSELDSYSAVDVFEAEVTGCRVAGFDNVEEVGVRMRVEKVEGRGGIPVEDKVEIEVCDRVAFNGCEGWMGLKVKVVFSCGKEGKEVFFKLEANKFVGADIANRA